MIDLKGPKTKQYKLHYNDIRGDFYGRKPAHHQLESQKWVFQDHWTNSKDCMASMRSLIWAFAGRQSHAVGNSRTRLRYCMRTSKALAKLRGCAGSLKSPLVAHHVLAQIVNYIFLPSNVVLYFYMHVSNFDWRFVGFNANKTYKISVLFLLSGKSNF